MTSADEVFRKEYLHNIDELISNIAYQIVEFADDNDYELSSVLYDAKKKINNKIEQIRKEI